MIIGFGVKMIKSLEFQYKKSVALWVVLLNS